MLNLLINLAISLTAVAPQTEMPNNFSPANYSQAITQLEEVIKNAPPEAPTEIAIEIKKPPTAEECSCVIHAARYINLPPMTTPADIEPNSDMWSAEAVLLNYKLPHIAVIEKIDNEGIWVHESNFKKCKIGRRVIPFNNPAIRGFWKS